jgi:hypothetical protein
MFHFLVTTWFKTMYWYCKICDLGSELDSDDNDGVAVETVLGNSESEQVLSDP